MLKLPLFPLPHHWMKWEPRKSHSPEERLLVPCKLSCMGAELEIVSSPCFLIMSLTQRFSEQKIIGWPSLPLRHPFLHQSHSKQFPPLQFCYRQRVDRMRFVLLRQERFTIMKVNHLQKENALKLKRHKNAGFPSEKIIIKKKIHGCLSLELSVSYCLFERQSEMQAGSGCNSNILHPAMSSETFPITPSTRGKDNIFFCRFHLKNQKKAVS